MDLFVKQNLTKEEALLLKVLKALGKKKHAPEKLVKNLEENEDNKSMLKQFFKGEADSRRWLLAVEGGSDLLAFSNESPHLSATLKKKAIVLIRITDADLEDASAEDALKDVACMEVSKRVLQNLQTLCQEVYLPVLSEPKNQVGWSDLVSKDLMDKFHSFLANIYVTIGQVDGRTMLPLPPRDVSQKDKTSSKDKAHILEGAIITWTKQIKNVLKQDPEIAFKDGKHPDPSAELRFWEHKSSNLNSIGDQLASDRIKKVLKFLDQNKSTYTNPFSKLQKEVHAARQESNENCKYLSTLKDLFDQLLDPARDLPQLADPFIGIMHTILLIWTYSQYYNTPSRLVVLIREICNAIISQCVNQVDKETIFSAIKNEQPKDAYDKLAQALDVCSKFKDAYFEYKAKANNQWKITTNALFVRLDAFSERCQDMMHLTHTIIQFTKLEKIEIGSTKGKQLTDSVKQIHEEFTEEVDKFTALNYEIMDIEQRQFDDDFFQFRCRIKELERRLASVLTQGFDDCDTIIAKFKLLDSFEGLLNRAIIQDELEKKHITLLELYKQDLKTVQSIFLEGKALIEKNDERAPISNNMPPIAGSLDWTRGLLERIKEPMDRLSQLSQAIREREEYKDVQKLYHSLCKHLKEFEDFKIKQWEASVEENTEEKLNQFLLVKEESDTIPEGILSVNFDPVLVRLLREVKYLLLQDVEVPERAQKLYEKVDTYRTQSGNLDLIINMYNDILATLLPVEKPLLRDRIKSMNDCLQPGIDTLRWNSDTIDTFITSCMNLVTDVDELVKKMKENIRQMLEKMKKWEKPLFERKNKPSQPDDLEQVHSAAVIGRHEDIKQDSKEILRLFKETTDAIRPDKKSAEWVAYQDYVNTLIIEGITRGINASMINLGENISIDYNKNSGKAAIFYVSVSLIDREVVFDPTIRSTVVTANDRGSGVRDIINRVIEGFIDVAIQVTRVDTGNGDYLVEIKDQFELLGSLQTISSHLDEMEQETDAFIGRYQSYKFLWEETLEENFAAFLETGSDPRKQRHTKRNEDGEEEEDESFEWMAGKILVNVHTQKPSLEDFDKRITYYHKVKDQISAMSTSTTIGWLTVNSQPLQQKLNTIVDQWVKRYTGFLLENTTTEIQNIKSFIEEVSDGIKTIPEKAESKAEKDILMQVMTHLRDVKMIKDRALGEIGPMREMIQLLKKHGVPMGEDYLVILEESKTSLNEVSEYALSTVKENILPLQTQESKNIKDVLAAFTKKVNAFRTEFQQSCPYHIETSSDEIIDQAYLTIADYYGRANELDEEAKDLNNLETLFDIQKSTYKQLKDCRSELVSLKYMWDLIALVDLQFASWKKTLWDKIETDLLTQLIKDMQTKQTNPGQPQNKDIRNWKAFTALNERVKNMNAILPLISQLHSPYMMDRHWLKLQRITQKTINFKSPNFCLEDLIKLELYRFAEEVNELVDGAQKESKIEIKLQKIEATWELQLFDFKEYGDTFILGAMDEIVENVETNQMDLMAMQSSKDVEEFAEKVNYWQRTLRQVDLVIQIWLKVQKNWQRLEPIFLQSEDIRQQLPDDTKRFEKIDVDWKEMMREANEEPGVVAAATYEGRDELLNTFHAEIEQCEKSLFDYLDQKKKMFPRFYFVSNQALLDILSNGNNPEKVDEYIGDCFDGMKRLDFVPRKEGQVGPCKEAKGMVSKEGELVPFEDNFVCIGAVESYLSDLEAKMQNTLRDVLEGAKATAEQWDLGEKPRHIWLEDYCAQVSLLTTQILWTEETCHAFDDLEGGTENAMKEYFTTILVRLNHLIERVRGDLSEELRIKIITIITIDVHERDVVDMFALKKIMEAGSFAWQSQLKFYWEPAKSGDKKTCYCRICDWETLYTYEYVGNTGRLVITPLTDRCYITLTQALNLTMGGAPAGPAGTGKTETTKDLGRALGLQVVVFNCSDQMNYQSMAQIFMGLAQTGAWGCFDEFNRISIEVLSVVSSQVKTVLDALKEFKKNPAKNVFAFQEEEISLRVTVGFFITMNPGYAGRTELPENLKALFRSCAMVTPDIVKICENMLMAEGFTQAKELSKKFMTLYDLCKNLLSKQTHYDWGLRAVKSVLRQAGMLKRADPDIPEDFILMRALRDFNKPKIITDDKMIFMGLIDDLFPGIEVASKIYPELQEAVENRAIKDGLQPEDGFVLKCIQLSEILEVRHSVFIIGNPGCGKTTVWKTLLGAFNDQGKECLWDMVDPKAVTNDELYGCMNPKTKEWKDGVISTLMRNMAKCELPYKSTQFMQGVILDGDIDPEWIETMNTVMDDNKVLTLVSQERIPLTAPMRLFLEISNLRNATPATVSRGGVLFINDTEVGWRPFMDSWMSKYKKIDENANSAFTLAFQQYVPDSFVDDMKSRETVCPMVDIAFIQALCCMVDAQYHNLYNSKKELSDFMKMLNNEGREDDIKMIYEGFFIFAFMWSFGACLTEERNWFNGYCKSASRVKFPDDQGAQCFDYYFDPLKLCWVHWNEKVSAYNSEYEGLFNNIVVPTADTTRQKYIIALHVQRRKGVLYVGAAGTGKTTVINDYFSGLDKDYTLSASISFNSYTDSRALQAVLESKVEKRAGNKVGPPPGKILVYFMDDLNMPYVDIYGTQSPIALMRQIIDYQIIYDREHLEDKKYLQDCMFTACMNPKSGSFNVDLRLQRHLSLFATAIPSKEILQAIYFQILHIHFQQFDPQISSLCQKLIDATMEVFNGITMSPQFAPTARKFHYQFNLRDFSKIVQNLMLTTPALYKGKPLDMIRLWLHELMRVFDDRLIDQADRTLFMMYVKNGIKKFSDAKEDDVLAEPIIYTSFVTACKGHDKALMPVADFPALKEVLEAKLAEYNEVVSQMDLVLFNQAMEHITRIARIIDLPVGNALLVGVGGSGKQSLSKLAAFILTYEVVRIIVSTNYGEADLKTDLQGFYQKSGVAGIQILFILTDTQIAEEQFLVFINDILSSGWIPDIFAKDELDAILGKVRTEAKAAGCQDTPDEIFGFYLDKVRKNFHLALCFSPVGEAFRKRARMFPGIINCTSMDWFHEWPKDALIDVANRFMADVDVPTEELKETLAEHMSFVHLSVAEANVQFRAAERRNNYTTPTSYLELINFYKILLSTKQKVINTQIMNLEQGLETMAQTTEQVEGLQVELEAAMKVVAIEKEKTDELIEIVGNETEAAEAEEAVATETATITAQAKANAEAEKAAANEELDAAIPAMEAAKAAVDCLNKASIQEMKALGSPPSAVLDVGKALLMVLKKEKKNHAWGNAQKMMGNPAAFLTEVQSFNANEIDEWILTGLSPILNADGFNQKDMERKSMAASYLCAWLVNIVIYNTIYKKVKPLMDASAAAEALAKQKQEEQAVVDERVRVVKERVAELNTKLDDAKEKKKAVEDDAQAKQDKLDLAQRLVNGLADENTRWKNNVAILKKQKLSTIGDAILAAAFVSYIGPFTARFRLNLWSEQWIPDITARKIPVTEGVDPLNVLATKAGQAAWNNEGLPADRMSLENASIITSCKRYPLMIDPQLQGQKWIKGREGNDMTIIQLTHKNALKKVEQAVTSGACLMIDSLSEEIDAVLDPLLSRQIQKKGKGFSVKLGAEDIDYDPKFQLYLQTKLINPHYKPETAAQCTIINFIVTESGLEDQLLAMVVRVEKSDLEQEKEELVNKQNEFQITLARLEAELLQNLSAADPATILDNRELVESLEVTKKTSTEIQKQQAIAKETEVRINLLREVYRPVAAEGAMLYFLLIQLNIVAHMYQYSLKSFETFFFKAIEKAELEEDEEKRCLALQIMIRKTIFQWVARGLFEKHKQIFQCQLTFRLMQKNPAILMGTYTRREMNFLLTCPPKTDVPNPLKDWLPDSAWFAVQRLIEIEGFDNFASNMEKEAPARFRDWYNELTPETEKVPLEWKKLEQMPFQKLLVVRCLRPDRITSALDNFIRVTLPNGAEYVDMDSTASFIQILQSSYDDSTSTTPIFFILSPGANPVAFVEELCLKNDKTPSKHLHTVSLGQGQDIVAMNKLEIGHKEGHWVMLQNIHLMPRWLLELEKKLDAFAIEGSHSDFRVFLSSDPSNQIPIGLLEKSIKLTNEPPQGLKPNMKRAFSSFPKEEIEEKDPKIKTILFGLCYFHTVMMERRKFGSKGWNMHYPFSMGDLRDSAIVLKNYMETNASSGKLPWDDLRYIFGEIMYGGHIVDNLDRKFCSTFLENLMNDSLLDEAELFPFIEGKNITFKCPQAMSYEKYIEHIENGPGDTPLAFGMHPNAEIDYRTNQCIVLFRTLQELAPKEAATEEGGGGSSTQEKIQEFMHRVSDEAQLDQNRLNIEDILSKMNEEKDPYQNVYLQECEAMNVLINSILKSLQELELGFKGELTITPSMEGLMDSVALNQVPPSWSKYAFPSTRPLGTWLDNLKHRLEQLNHWKEDPVNIPKVVFLNRLFNPQSFLTAIKQVYSRKNKAELNRLTIQTDVLKYMYWQPELPACKDGAYIFGCQVEGARWDQGLGNLEESFPKKQFSVVPVINCRAVIVAQEGKEEKGVYQCPTYKTETRGATYVFTAQMKTKLPPQKWILAGVAMILDVEGVSDAFALGKDPTAI